MQEFNARGVITNIIYASGQVFIFGFKTLEKYPLLIKVKKFCPKGANPDAFIRACEPFIEGSTIVMSHSRLTSEKATKDGAPVLTTENIQVYTPVIVAGSISVESASFDSLYGDQAETSEPPAPAPAQPTPVAVQAAKTTPSPARPAQAFHEVAPAEELDHGFPTIPFN